MRCGTFAYSGLLGCSVAIAAKQRVSHRRNDLLRTLFHEGASRLAQCSRCRRHVVYEDAVASVYVADNWTKDRVSNVAFGGFMAVGATSLFLGLFPVGRRRRKR